MKKIDLSKTIGVIKRGGSYSPSNERSEEKWNDAFSRTGYWPAPATIDDDMMPLFMDITKKCGYKVRIIQRGLFR